MALWSNRVAAVLGAALVIAAPAWGQTQERGDSSPGDSSPAASANTTLSCPQSRVSGSFTPATSLCPACAHLAEASRNQVAYIEQLQARLNATIDEYNAICAPPTLADYPTVDEDGAPISYCGPDVTPMFVEALVRIKERMKDVPDDNKGAIDGLSFLLDNGINIDIKPLLSAWHEAGGGAVCPSGACAAAGNAKGQDCYSLWGYCVPQHVMNDIMFGFVASEVGVSEIAQILGGQYHEISSRFAFDPITSAESYRAGSRMAQAMDDAGRIPPSTIITWMGNINTEMELFNYPWIVDCVDCPDPTPMTHFLADFSTRDWLLAGGGRLTADQSATPVTDGLVGNRTALAGSREARAQHRADQRAHLAQRIGELQHQYDAAIAELERIAADIDACAQRHCVRGEPSEMARLFGEIFAGGDPLDPDYTPPFANQPVDDQGSLAPPVAPVLEEVRFPTLPAEDSCRRQYEELYAAERENAAAREAIVRNQAKLHAHWEAAEQYERSLINHFPNETALIAQAGATRQAAHEAQMRQHGLMSQSLDITGEILERLDRDMAKQLPCDQDQRTALGDGMGAGDDIVVTGEPLPATTGSVLGPVGGADLSGDGSDTAAILDALAPSYGHGDGGAQRGVVLPAGDGPTDGQPTGRALIAPVWPGPSDPAAQMLYDQQQAGVRAQAGALHVSVDTPDACPAPGSEGRIDLSAPSQTRPGDASSSTSTGGAPSFSAYLEDNRGVTPPDVFNGDPGAFAFAGGHDIARFILWSEGWFANIFLSDNPNTADPDWVDAQRALLDEAIIATLAANGAQAAADAVQMQNRLSAYQAYRQEQRDDLASFEQAAARLGGFILLLDAFGAANDRDGAITPVSPPGAIVTQSVLDLMSEQDQIDRWIRIWGPSACPTVLRDGDGSEARP